jgi:NAD(P)-dependent dehydrogenase (short-subunit alcohol dehydrogenase family)
MSESKVILVTGASSGFGALTVRTLADAKHVVYAGMRGITGRNEQSAAAARAYADEHGGTDAGYSGCAGLLGLIGTEAAHQSVLPSVGCHFNGYCRAAIVRSGTPHNDCRASGRTR